MKLSPERWMFEFFFLVEKSKASVFFLKGRKHMERFRQNARLWARLWLLVDVGPGLTSLVQRMEGKLKPKGLEFLLWACRSKPGIHMCFVS